MKKKTEFYKEEIQIPSRVGFCKNCFRNKREGSAYCGKCQGDEERMKLYISDTRNFPLLNEVMERFSIASNELDTIVFTYGDTFFAKDRLSYGLIAHEVTHTFQQLAMGVDNWWKKYFEDNQFRISQEVEAYQNQYRTYKDNDVSVAENMVVGLANDLSGKLYGEVMTYEEALKLIKS